MGNLFFWTPPLDSQKFINGASKVLKLSKFILVISKKNTCLDAVSEGVLILWLPVEVKVLKNFNIYLFFFNFERILFFWMNWYFIKFADSKVYLWHKNSKEPVGILEGHCMTVKTLNFSKEFHFKNKIKLRLIQSVGIPKTHIFWLLVQKWCFFI